MEFRTFLEALDRDPSGTVLSQADADPESLTPLSEGAPIRGRLQRAMGRQYQDRLAEAARFCGEVYDGRRRIYHLTEALSTGDFPLLFADIIDRQLLASYQAPAFNWPQFVRISPNIQDFRTVSRFRITGGDDILLQVGEQAPYPEADMAETRYQYAVVKYGRDIPISFETMINDDLDAFRDLPARLARGAQRSEAKFVTGLYCDADGPHDSLVVAANNNIIDLPLSIANLAIALTTMTTQTDPKTGEPILINGTILVVPPALEVTARAIVESDLMQTTTTAGVPAPTVNMMARRNIRVVVDAYIPIVMSSSGGAVSWFLFAEPSAGAALEVGFLRGRRAPELLIKQPAFAAVGGGSDQMGLDESDTRRYRVRHIFGGAQMDPRFIVGSDGVA